MMPDQALSSTALSTLPLLFAVFRYFHFSVLLLIVNQENEFHLISRQLVTAFLGHHDSVDMYITSRLVSYS